MFQNRLSANVKRINAEIAVIQVRGEINLYSENVLMDAFLEASRGETSTVILNFDALEYMNSAGIGLLITMLMRANRNGQRLVACCMKPHYREIFSITRLDEAIKIYANEAEAVAAVPPAVSLPGTGNLLEVENRLITGGN